MVILTLILIGVAAFILNFPFGILRVKTRKYSLAWLLCIHIPVIPVIFMRISTGFTYRVIPFTLGVSILGQFLGARAGRWWFSS
ncbi:MAG: hypothetical protein HZA12_06845 [Nitrospirae bacterium]|nr:hypothetical protein [Nitrospirota bacterium]